MSGLVESASAILRASERRLETASQNVANITTAGYKRQVSFASVIAGTGAVDAATAIRVRPDFAQGKLSATGNPLDIAISGDGFFQLRDGDATVYSRQGQFTRSPDGTLVTPQGYVLQQAGGGDLAVDHADIVVEADGTVLDAGRPVARIGVYMPNGVGGVQALDGSAFRFATDASEVTSPMLRQGMTEAFNVSIGDEMTGMMAALRQAESGSRLVQTYDDLLGRAITAFGPAGQ